MDVTFFPSPSDLRDWLAAHHNDAPELLIGFYKKGASATAISYAEALDEALCYGWIDGVRKRLDDASYTIRFTRRKPRSIWSAVNIKRAEELIALGRMQPPGLAAFAGRDPARQNLYSFEQEQIALDDAAETRFRADAPAWDFFRAQAPSYQRAALWWVVSAKRDETQRRRLDALIACSGNGQRLPHLLAPSRSRKDAE